MISKRAALVFALVAWVVIEPIGLAIFFGWDPATWLPGQAYGFR